MLQPTLSLILTLTNEIGSRAGFVLKWFGKNIQHLSRTILLDLFIKEGEYHLRLTSVSAFNKRVTMLEGVFVCEFDLPHLYPRLHPPQKHAGLHYQVWTLCCGQKHN